MNRIEPTEVATLVIAKEPRPGLAKTRLAPALGPEGSAALAEAALADTLEAVAGVDGRRVLVLEGQPGGWLPEGFEVIPQRGRGLDERLASAFEDAGAPAFLVGMDTPQITTETVERGRTALCADGIDAVLGEATDGGWWAIGIRNADRRVFDGVPMSLDTTGASQRRRLEERGLRWEPLEVLNDVDTIEDAREVARLAPHGRFAAELARLERADRSPA